MPVYTIPCSWSGDWGSFMYCDFTFNLTVTVDDLYTTADCVMTDFNYWRRDGESTGYGFINVGGIMWDNGEFAGAYANPDTAPETWANVESELRSTIPNYDVDNIFGVYCSDEPAHATQGVTGGILAGLEVVKTFDLSGGVSGEACLIRPYERYRDNANDLARIDSQGGFTLTWAEVFQDYYPWAGYLSGGWHSYNDGSPAVGVFKRSGTSWADAKNSILSDEVSAQSVLKRSSNAWAKADDMSGI